MEVELTHSIPDAWKDAPCTTYETQYVYIGFRRLNVKTRKLQSLEIIPQTGFWMFSEEDNLHSGVLSRAYHTEHVTVTDYSKSPRVWSESLAPDQVFFFRQLTDGAVARGS
jgi:hypothetical protein